MTEIERLQNLGKNYLIASGKLLGYDGERDIPRICGNGDATAKLIIDVAKLIVAADSITRKADPHD